MAQRQKAFEADVLAFDHHWHWNSGMDIYVPRNPNPAHIEAYYNRLMDGSIDVANLHDLEAQRFLLRLAVKHLATQQTPANGTRVNYITVDLNGPLETLANGIDSIKQTRRRYQCISAILDSTQHGHEVNGYVVSMGPAALAALRLLFDRARTYAKEYNSERRPQNLLALRNAVAAFRDALCAGPVGPAPAQLNQINQLTNDLTQRNQTIQTQNTEIVDLRVQVARLNHDLNDYETTIEDQQAELEELRELREEMNRDNDNDDDDDDDDSDNNNDDNGDNDDSEAPPDDAKIGSGEKDQLIARLRHAGLKLRNKKDALKGIIAERDERITALEKDVKKYSTALVTIAERDSNALATIAERDAQIRSLQKQLSELGQELSAERKHKKPRSGTGKVSPDETVTDQQNARAGPGNMEPINLEPAMQAAEEGANP